MKHPPHIVVGFTGRSGSGKTTIAGQVRERIKLTRPRLCNVSVFKFARPIREMLRVVGVEKGDEAGETANPHFRSAAQGIGQLMRKLDPDFWVNVLTHAVAGQSAPTVVLIDDLRFPNEATACDMIVQLRTERDNGLTAQQMLDTSETSWQTIPAHMVFENDRPEDIERIADDVFGRITELLA